jgi:prepilin peptidase CpaA
VYSRAGVTSSSALSYALLVLTAGILVRAAIVDLREFRIPNGLIIILGLLYFIHAGIVGEWARMPGNIGLAFAVLALLLLFYAPGHVGGGDVKLLAVAFLWTGIDCAFSFSVMLLVFVLLHLVAVKFGLVAYTRVGSETGNRIAFAPSIAGALIGVFMLGCLSG